VRPLTGAPAIAAAARDAPRPARDGGLDEGARCPHARGQVRDVARACRLRGRELAGAHGSGRIVEQRVRHVGQHVAQQRVGDQRRQRGVGRGDVAAGGEQHVLPHQREGRPRARLVHAAPVVMHVQRGAVIDQPRPPLPDEQVRVASRAVHVGHERVEPDHARRQLGVDQVARGQRVEVERAVQVAHADVAAEAPAQQLLDLGVALHASELGRQVDQREIGHRQPQRARQPAHHQLGDQHPRALPGTAELHHPEPAIVGGVDDGRQRAPLAQGLDVAGGDERGKRHAGE
jgi:hypothetical protein